MLAAPILQSVTLAGFGLSYPWGLVLDSRAMNLHRTAIALCFVLLPAAAWSWAGWDPNGGPKGGGYTIDVGTACEDLSAEPITYGMTYNLPGSGLPDAPIDVHDIWLAGGCVGCHNVTAMGQLRLDLDNVGGYELVYESSFRDSSIRLVQPGEPESSLLYTMLNCTPPGTYPVMPPAVDGMSQRIARPLRALVHDWIQQGARGFDEDGNPYSDVLFRDQVESSRNQKVCMLAGPTPDPSCKVSQ
jgi:hypothetical protein